MKPKEIPDALRRRDEDALRAVQERYGPYIRKIAFDILHSEEDVREVENSVYLKLWQETGKQQTGIDAAGRESSQPADLKAFLGMLSRQTAIDRLRTVSAARRGSREYELALDELAEVLTDPGAEDPADRLALKNAMSGFLRGLPKRERQLFLCRYWYAMSVRECMDAFGMKESAVKTALHRTREKLRVYLEKEGISI